MAQQPPFTDAATVDANGFASVSFTPRANQVNRVAQVGVELVDANGDPSPEGIGSIRRNGWLVTPFVPAGDAPAGYPYIWLWPGADEMTVEVRGATPGRVLKATIFWDLGSEA